MSNFVLTEKEIDKEALLGLKVIGIYLRLFELKMLSVFAHLHLPFMIMILRCEAKRAGSCYFLFGR